MGIRGDGDSGNIDDAMCNRWERGRIGDAQGNRTDCEEAEKITPGFNSPTINSLEDQDWCAVQVMVKRKELIDVMDRLEAIGATAILETQINNCRL